MQLYLQQVHRNIFTYLLNFMFAPIFFNILMKPIRCGFKQTFFFDFATFVRIAMQIKNALDEISDGTT